MLIILSRLSNKYYRNRRHITISGKNFRHAGTVNELNQIKMASWSIEFGMKASDNYDRITGITLIYTTIQAN